MLPWVFDRTVPADVNIAHMAAGLFLVWQINEYFVIDLPMNPPHPPETGIVIKEINACLLVEFFDCAEARNLHFALRP